MIAPSDAPVNTKRPTEEQKQTGAQKFRQATEKRLAKVNSFFGEEAGNALENSKEIIRKFKNFSMQKHQMHFGKRRFWIS